LVGILRSGDVGGKDYQQHQDENLHYPSLSREIMRRER
jgi:hypothetical protein